MSETTLSQKSEKSTWSKRLGVGCGVILALGFVGLFVANILIENYFVNRVESGFADLGWKAEIGEFDFSLMRKEIELSNFSAVPTSGGVYSEYGNVAMERGTIIFTTDRENNVAELHLNGLTSSRGSIKKMDVVFGKLIEFEGVAINNPPEFGGGPLMEFKVIKLEYAETAGGKSDHFKEVRVEIQRINIVRNKQGLWLTDLSKKDEKKMSERKGVAAIDKLTITVGEISFQDLAGSDPPKVVKVNKEITVDDPKNPRAYPMIVFPKLLWISRQAKKKFGI